MSSPLGFLKASVSRRTSASGASGPTFEIGQKRCERQAGVLRPKGRDDGDAFDRFADGPTPDKLMPQTGLPVGPDKSCIRIRIAIKPGLHGRDGTANQFASLRREPGGQSRLHARQSLSDERGLFFGFLCGRENGDDFTIFAIPLLREVGTTHNQTHGALK